LLRKAAKFDDYPEVNRKNGFSAESFRQHNSTGGTEFPEAGSDTETIQKSNVRKRMASIIVTDDAFSSMVAGVHDSRIIV
jgi:hypothetical protein